MKLQRVYAIGLVAVLLIGIAIFIAYEHNTNSRQQNYGPTTNSFFLEPVVDVIIPSLFTNNVNTPLNLTRGATATLIVEIFPLVNLEASVKTTINSLSYPDEKVSSFISTSFNPPQLSIVEGASANTTLDINVSQAASVGAYSVTVTATNLENASQYWGTIFPMNIAG